MPNISGNLRQLPTAVRSSITSILMRRLKVYSSETMGSGVIPKGLEISISSIVIVDHK